MTKFYAKKILLRNLREGLESDSPRANAHQLDTHGQLAFDFTHLHSYDKNDSCFLHDDSIWVR